MKIIRNQDIVVKTSSVFDWDGFVETFDWVALYDSFWMDIYGYMKDEDELAVPIMRDGYRLISLNLPLTSEDMKAIEEKCSDSFFELELPRYVFKLIENMLFVVDDVRGACWVIMRFQPTASGYLAVEILENSEELHPGEPLLCAEYIADWLSDLLPSPRFDIADTSDWEKGFCWREAGDPEHEPDTRFFRNGDILVSEHSDFDWDGLLDSFDWPSLYRTCYAHWYFADSHSDCGHRVGKRDYRIVPLDLALSAEDMIALATASEKASSDWWGGHEQCWLIDGRLYVIDDKDGLRCTSVIRFEKTMSGWRAVEYIEDTIKRKVETPLASAAEVALRLAGRINGRRRFEWIDTADHGQGWYWRGPGKLLETAS